MYKLHDFECTACDHQFEDVVDTNEVRESAEYERHGIMFSFCPKCGEISYEIIGNPGHHKHVSWSKWRVDHA